MTLAIQTEKRSSYLELLGSAVRSRFWLGWVDIYPALAAALLPWSTSGVSICLGIWFLIFIPTINSKEFAETLKAPASILPLVFMALAIIGMFWADGSWSVRMHGLRPVLKFLILPYLLYHYSRSQRAHWVFVAFLASCTLLTVVSWLAFFAGWKLGTLTPGIPVNNYIDQSQALTLCIFALAPYLASSLAQRKWKRAIPLAVLMAAIFCNLMFVALARTALLYIPVLAALFAIRYLSPKRIIALSVLSVFAAITLWFTSPYLRERYEFTVRDYKVSQSTDVATSNGERLAYWRASMKWIAQAPVIGHGTGATDGLFKAEAAGKSGEWANIIRNPHNQTLYVLIEWGILGCIVLYAMWYFHLELFLERDVFSWIGLVVVVQNFVSSLLNSHLFDFHEGWIYALGVGVAGGIRLNAMRAGNESKARAGLPKA
jgi:O-antigen ligase